MQQAYKPDSVTGYCRALSFI